LTTLIRNFKKLKEQNGKLKKNLNKQAKDWMRDLDQSSSQFIEVIEIKKSFEKL
jgi:ATP-dependent protease HslVU (ClpYQ) peptidase subunit